MNKIINVLDNSKININSQTKQEISVIDFCKSNITKKINCNIEKGHELKINFFISAKNANKEYVVSFDNKENTKFSCNIYCFCIKNSTINIKLSNSVGIIANNVECKQLIKGIIFDNNSTIDVEPIIIANNNTIHASHEVDIGNIDYNQLFYLLSRGVEKKEATNMLILSALNSCEIDNEIFKKLENIL
ncbi:MAG: SufD family Fe-S cluster assembly protein [Mycoplasmataceae bacterium]|jgi:Fe-S cluster assembly protein SufD|nr:SufD family Fe-S cluster assembly protein [Mycoplasmataceae bacterium]